MKISELNLKTKKAGITIKMKEIRDLREVVSNTDGKLHLLCEALIGDETGSVFISLWDGQIKQMESGKYYKITECYCSKHKGAMILNIGKNGKITKTEDKFEINTKNNLSLKEIHENTLL
ncbi:MAG TPA: hypothetical protein VFF13_00275 [archaeon]|nr:hypothetical protein [archaeon]